MKSENPTRPNRVRHNFNPGLHIHTICTLTRLAGIIRRIARPCQSDLEPKKVERASVRMRRLLVNATSQNASWGSRQIFAILQSWKLSLYAVLGYDVPEIKIRTSKPSVVIVPADLFKKSLTHRLGFETG